MNNVRNIPCRFRIMSFQRTVVFFLLFQTFLHLRVKGHRPHFPKFMAWRYGQFKYSDLLSCLSLTISHGIYVPADLSDLSNRTTTTSFHSMKTYITVMCKLDCQYWCGQVNLNKMLDGPQILQLIQYVLYLYHVLYFAGRTKGRGYLLFIKCQALCL